MKIKEFIELFSKYEDNGVEYIESENDITNIFGYDMGNGRILFDRNNLEEYIEDEELDETDDEWITTHSISLIPFSVKSVEELRKKVDETEYIVSFFDGEGQDFVTACIGIDENSGRLVYDYNDMIEYWINNGGTEEDAIDWIDYNTIRSLPYFEKSPIIIDRSYIL